MQSIALSSSLVCAKHSCGMAQQVSDFSESTGRAAMLCAPLRAPGPPTMVLGGFAMHRISGGDQKSVRTYVVHVIQASCASDVTIRMISATT